MCLADTCVHLHSHVQFCFPYTDTPTRPREIWKSTFPKTIPFVVAVPETTFENAVRMVYAHSAATCTQSATSTHLTPQCSQMCTPAKAHETTNTVLPAMLTVGLAMGDPLAASSPNSCTSASAHQRGVGSHAIRRMQPVNAGPLIKINPGGCTHTQVC